MHLFYNEKISDKLLENTLIIKETPILTQKARQRDAKGCNYNQTIHKTT